MLLKVLFNFLRSFFSTENNAHPAPKNLEKINHLAVVMDGNRRWAKAKNLPLTNGYKAGLKALKLTIDFCLKKQIKYLSCYTLSIENLKRTESELEPIFGLINLFYKENIQELKESGIKIKILGKTSLLNKEYNSIFNEIESNTANGKRLTVNLLICYGGQQEIVDATKKVVRLVNDHKLDIDEIDQSIFEQFLWTHNIPSPEVVIRTGGHKRLSNFLLWQVAYSEIFFLDILWPDLSEKILEQCCKNYFNSKKNFGR